MSKDVIVNADDLDKKVQELHDAKPFKGKCDKCGYIGDGQMVVTIDQKTLAAVCIVCFGKLITHTCGKLIEIKEETKPANRKERRKGKH